MAETGYKPVPHDAAIRKVLLAKPGTQKALDTLEEEYTALLAMLAAHQVAVRQGRCFGQSHPHPPQRHAGSSGPV